MPQEKSLTIISVWIFSILSSFVILILGILAIMSIAPFEHQNFSLGIILIILACIGIIGVVVDIISTKN